MKKWIKNFIYAFLTLFRSNGGIILMYHSVGENNEFFSILPQEFERQLDYLRKKKIKILTLEELIGRVRSGSDLSGTVCLTFDDGWRDNYLNVFPVLKKYRAPATIFLDTASIGGRLKTKKGPELPKLTLEEIKELDRSGLVEFGAHGHRHIKLGKLSEAEAEQEMIESKKTLEEILNRQISFFAYPFGDFNENTAALARKHFKAAVGVRKGRVRQGANLAALPRNSVDSTVSFIQFKGIVRFGRI